MKTTKHRGSAPRRIAVTVAATTVGLLIGIGSAAAYWATTGTGTGAASARTMVAPGVTATGAAPSAQLYPGSTGGDLVVMASNTNPFPVTVTLAASTSASGCTTPAITFSGGSFTLPANSGSVSRTVANSVSMGTGASNDCQGATITVALNTSSASN